MNELVESALEHDASSESAWLGFATGQRVRLGDDTEIEVDTPMQLR